MKDKLIKYLTEFITDNRIKRFNEIIQYRTRYITVVLEDIFQPHNASAVLRSCDCFGVQDVHIIENKNKYNINPDVALGSNKWLNLLKYNKEKNNTVDAIKKIKSKGYRIIATTPHNNSVNLDEFDIEKGKIALLFGTELNGLSNEALDYSDEYLKIPMYGFTESLNISVSTAIILKSLIYKLHHSEIQWALSEEEMTNLKLKWLKNSIKNSELLIKKFNK
ncbi:TrmH family RNA methyltransferase [Bacteroidota bacterium]